jgi:hypothetical protein
MSTNRLFREFENEDGVNCLELANGQILRRFHTKAMCKGACPIHAPLDNVMSKWPLNWRNDRFIFERICKCGIGHPCPESLAFMENDEGVHGCCGCCAGAYGDKQD